MAKQAVDHHKRASEYHEKAASIMGTAHLAHGHSQQAIHHGTDAAKAHGEHHGE